MFDSTWLAVQEARAAIRQGRFVQAYRAVQTPRLRRRRESGKIAVRASRKMQARWLDMARKGFAEAVLAEMRHAADVVAGDAVLDRIHEGLRAWVRARRLAGAGREADARVGLTRAAALLPELAPLPDLGPDIASEDGMHAAADGGLFAGAHRLEPESPTEQQRLFLWVDGVGGYLVCLGDRVRVGQAAPESPAEAPVLADLSRVHATIERSEGEYMVTAHRATRRNGRPIERTALTEGDRLGMGSAEFEFHRPNPGSGSAVLTVVSAHRLPWAVDAVLLWADRLQLGPSAHSHVVCPNAPEPVILFRQADGLWCRGAGLLRIDGREVDQPARLDVNVQVRASGLSFALEPVQERPV